MTGRACPEGSFLHHLAVVVVVVVAVGEMVAAVVVAAGGLGGAVEADGAGGEATHGCKVAMIAEAAYGDQVRAWASMHDAFTRI